MGDGTTDASTTVPADDGTTDAGTTVPGDDGTTDAGTTVPGDDGTTDAGAMVPADDELARAEREVAALSAASYADPTAQCDMIMKGGITSGVVYPLTICKVATRYRLRSIGGTSAGAIAAVVAAAAEHRRQLGGPDAGEGYRQLACLPDDVAGQLAGLFQPHPTTRGIFGVLFAAIDPDSRGSSKVRRVVAAVLRHQLSWFVGGVLVVLGLVVPGLIVTSGFPIDGGGWGRILLGLVLPVFLALVVGIVAAAVGLVREAMRVLPRRDYGLTDGATHGDSPALTDWLADRIDAVAGITDADRCLTLGDLWGSEAVGAWASASGERVQGSPVSGLRARRRVELEVMTTDLTVRRPFRLPFDEQTFLFDPDEMRRLFPRRAVDVMQIAPSDHVNPATGGRLWYFPGPGRGTPGEREHRPGPEALPVIVMARMSLSFPGLISAVPLYAVDFNGDQSVVRHLFSDGGVSSNFPMHFFDAMLPTRPTFGVNLAPLHPVHPETKVWRPGATTGGTIPRAQPFDGVGGFVAALRDTMQNWADNRQVTQRGYADRVVEIRLASDEGGMNLRMPRPLILRLVARGAAAGDELLGFDWDAHRIIRYRVAMARLSDTLDRLRSAWTLGDGALYPDLVAGYPDGSTGHSYLGGAAWRVADRAATDALVDAVAAWEAAGWPALSAERPAPAPVLRAVPE